MHHVLIAKDSRDTHSVDLDVHQITKHRHDWFRVIGGHKLWLHVTHGCKGESVEAKILPSTI